LASYFLDRRACEVVIAEGMREGCFSANPDVGPVRIIGRQCAGHLSFTCLWRSSTACHLRLQPDPTR